MDSTIKKLLKDVFSEPDENGPLHQAFNEANVRTIEDFALFEPSPDVPTTFDYHDEEGRRRLRQYN